MAQVRQMLEQAAQAGPVLFEGLPGDEVDLDRLVAHLAARGLQAGVRVRDQETDAVLWIRSAGVGEVWVAEAWGGETILPEAAGRDRLRAVIARGGVVSVIVGPPPLDSQPQAPEATVVPQAPVASQAPLTPHTPEAREPPAADPPRRRSTVSLEPPPRPWPAILRGVAIRVERQRGSRLADRFVSALAKALAAHGGRLDGDRIVAPDLPESTWRVIVEAACAPVVGVAGRAFTDRAIAEAENEARKREAAGDE